MKEFNEETKNEKISVIDLMEELESYRDELTNKLDIVNSQIAELIGG